MEKLKPFVKYENNQNPQYIHLQNLLLLLSWKQYLVLHWSCAAMSTVEARIQRPVGDQRGSRR